MPNPKTGTVTPDVAKAVSDIKGGKIEFRTDRQGNLHFVIGKASFPSRALLENYAAALDEVIRLKPAAAKGRYVKKATITTTMGPGIPVDPNKTSSSAEDAAVEPAARRDPIGPRFAQYFGTPPGPRSFPARFGGGGGPRML